MSGPIVPSSGNIGAAEAVDQTFPYHRQYSSNRPATDLQAVKLMSFYNARGGLKYFIDYLDTFHGAELQILKNRCRILNRKLREVIDENLISKPILNNIFMDSYICLRGRPGSGGIPSDEDISGWMQKIYQMENYDFKKDLLRLAEDIRCYWRLNSKILINRQNRALLDLTVWKDSVVSVEVKAPNDRLQAHQREQLYLDLRNGIESWVIEVRES
ncbi:hypothetical protein ABWH93_01685 [Seohaeicola saemankumensis]|uniref:hypothetical protein n=1 Tax=Seohaeicola saemankumensis TaxID=481181 RepID=UPI0035CF9F32